MRYKQREAIRTRVLLNGRASLFISSNGQWVPEYDLVFVSLEKDYYPSSYSFFLRALNIADGNNDSGPIFEEELSIPFKVEKREGFFLHFPTEEFHVGFAFNDEHIAMKFFREIEDLNFLEMKNFEYQMQRYDNNKTLRKSNNSKNQRSSQNPRTKRDESVFYKDRKLSSRSGMSSTTFRRRPSRSESYQKHIIDPKVNKSECGLVFEKRSIVSYASDDSVSCSESASRCYSNSRNETASILSGQVMKNKFSQPLAPPPPFEPSKKYSADGETISYSSTDDSKSRKSNDEKHSKSDFTSTIKNFFNPQKTILKLNSRRERNSSPVNTSHSPAPPPPPPPNSGQNKTPSIPCKPAQVSINAPAVTPMLSQNKSPPVSRKPVKASINAPPAPPPPPAPSALSSPPPPQLSSNPLKIVPSAKPKFISPLSDPHSELLDSIRNHSKRKLKSVQTINKTDSKFTGDSSPGNSTVPKNLGLKASNGLTRKKNPIEDQLNSVLSNFVMPTKK